MNGNEFLDKMELVDPAFIAEAEAAPKKKKIWVKWCAAAAACICLVAGAFAAEHFSTVADYPAADSIEHAAYGFTLEGNDYAWYFPISFDDRIRYELVPEVATGLTSENKYTITKADLGEKMGTVAVCGDESLIGSTVYHFSKFPEYDSICILESDSGYAFYSCAWLNTPDEIGVNSDVALSANGLPDSVESVRVLTPASEPLFAVENEDTVSAILKILSGKVNSGLEANERRFADAWYSEYGNRDFYFNEEEGYCQATDISVYDKVTEFITNGECLIEIRTANGFTLTVDFFPCINTFIFGNGYYEMSPEESKVLASLLA